MTTTTKTRAEYYAEQESARVQTAAADALDATHPMRSLTPEQWEYIRDLIRWAYVAGEGNGSDMRMADINARYQLTPRGK